MYEKLVQILGLLSKKLNNLKVELCRLDLETGFFSVKHAFPLAVEYNVDWNVFCVRNTTSRYVLNG